MGQHSACQKQGHGQSPSTQQGGSHWQAGFSFSVQGGCITMETLEPWKGSCSATH